jgi:glutamate-1-semialdehyde 2,1-aminomutase
MNIHQSELWAKRARTVAPGGVNSPVRAFTAVGGTPITFATADGSWLIDVDGNRYIDLINSWGPMILGHRHPAVVAAVEHQLHRAMSFGAPSTLEVELAERMCSVVPGLERVRLVSSGTEACMSAVRVARAATSREMIVKFAGCYHGHADAFLISAGSGALANGVPSSPGIPAGVAAATIVVPYNDIEAICALFDKQGSKIAAVIVEPIAGNMGCVPPKPGFLETLRALCSSHGSVLIFDEVMTGFRLALGGAQQTTGVHADLVTFGKVLGGGMPLAAFGGTKTLMDMVSPAGPVYQAGTLSGHPVAVAAGIATLDILTHEPELYSSLDVTARGIGNRIQASAAKHAIPMTINQYGSMLSIHFSRERVTDLDSAMQADVAMFRTFFHGMLNHGVYLPPSAFESWFVSAAIGSTELDQISLAANAVFEGMRARLQHPS